MTLREPVDRVQGARDPEEFTIYQDGVVLDISAATLSLTVNTKEDGTGTDMFTLDGTVTDGPNGVVEFAISAVQADIAPGLYYYDILMTIGTIPSYPTRGTWRVRASIS